MYIYIISYTYIALVFLACISFADDICLIAATSTCGAMQIMIKICEEYCKEFCLSFYVKKSKTMLFAKKTSHGLVPASLIIMVMRSNM
jgi:hypothetical protein